MTDPEVAEPWVLLILSTLGGVLGLGFIGRTALNLLGPRLIMFGLGKVHDALAGGKTTPADDVLEVVKSRLADKPDAK